MQVIIDERIDKKIEKYFEELNIDIIKVKKNDNIYEEISSHTDINCIKIDNILVSTRYMDLNEKYTNIVSENLNNEYPFTAKYNVCILGDFAIHNFDITDSNIKRILTEKGYKLIHVSQGYTRCNIIPLNSNSCITSDKGIYKILDKNNFDVLFIDKDDLDIKLLKNNSYSQMSGFIGGCSGILNDTVIFFGDINKFKCKEKITNYINSKGFKIKDFKGIDMIDYGSCIFLE